MTNFDRQRRDIERITTAAADAVEGWVHENQLALSSCTMATETRLIIRAAAAYLVGEQLVLAAAPDCFADPSGRIDPVHEADLDAALEHALKVEDRIDAVLADQPQEEHTPDGVVCGGTGGC